MNRIRSYVWKFCEIPVLILAFFYGERALQLWYTNAPVSYVSTQGQQITAYSTEGDELWHIVVPDPIMISRVAIDPLDSSRRTVLIGVKKEVDDPSTASGSTCALRAYTTTTNWIGNIILGRRPENIWNATDTNGEYGVRNPHYVIADILPLTTPIAGAPCVAVEYIDTWEYPLVIALYDLRTGQIRSKFIHPGRSGTMRLARFNGDSKEYILLNSPNNALRMNPQLFDAQTIHPSKYPEALCLLDPERMSGCAPPPIAIEGDGTGEYGTSERDFSPLWYGVFPIRSDTGYRIRWIQFVEGPVDTCTTVPSGTTVMRCELTDGRWFLIDKEGKTRGAGFSESTSMNDAQKLQHDTMRIISRPGEYFADTRLISHHGMLTRTAP